MWPVNDIKRTKILMKYHGVQPRTWMWDHGQEIRHPVLATLQVILGSTSCLGFVLSSPDFQTNLTAGKDARCFLFWTNSYECHCWERIHILHESYNVLEDKEPKPLSPLRTLKTFLWSLDFIICSRHPLKSHPPPCKKASDMPRTCCHRIPELTRPAPMAEQRDNS